MIFQLDEVLKSVDSYIGKLMNGLTEKGLHHCLNIVIVADHGKLGFLIIKWKIIKWSWYVQSKLQLRCFTLGSFKFGHWFFTAEPCSNHHFSSFLFWHLGVYTVSTNDQSLINFAEQLWDKFHKIMSDFQFIKKHIST